MKGFYGRGRFDLDTYEFRTIVPRSGTDLKSDMDLVTTELDLLSAGSGDSPEYLLETVEQVRDNGRLSGAITEPSGWVSGWGTRYGRQMVGDVVDSANALWREVYRANRNPSAREWQRVRRSIHQSWFSFRNTTHTD